MQVILLEKLANLGNLGDVVKVKDGYGRNFLIPQKKQSVLRKLIKLSLKHSVLTLRSNMPHYWLPLKNAQKTLKDLN